MEGREHGIGREGLDAEHGFNGAGCTQAVARHHLGRAHAHRRVLFAEERLEGRHFGIVVLARTRTVRIHVTDIGLRDAGIFDGAVHGLHQAECIFTRGGNVVCVARDAGTEDFAVLLCTAFLSMFKGFDNHHAGAFAKRNAVAMVKRRAAVLVEGMERKEAGIRHSRKGIRTARNHHVGLARTDKVAGERNRDSARGTGVRHVRHDAAGTAHFGNLACNGRNRHLGNVGGFLGTLVIMFDGNDATDAATDNDAHSLVVVEIGKARIGQGLVCRLDAEFRDAVLFFGGVDLVKRIAIDFGSQIRIAVHCIDRSCLVDARDGLERIIPSFFDIVTDCTNHAKAGNHTTVFFKRHNHSIKKKVQGSLSWGPKNKKTMP